MKKLMKIILCLVLVFSFIPKEETEAGDTVKSVWANGNTLTWEAYPGAVSYLVTFGEAGDMVKTTRINLLYLGSSLSLPEGDYDVYVYALNENGSTLAEGKTTKKYHYREVGQIENIRIEGDTLTWDPYPGVAMYSVDFGEGVYSHWTEETSVDLMQVCYNLMATPGEEHSVFVYATNQYEDILAAGRSLDDYYYRGSGYITNAHLVEDEDVVTWDPYPGAAYYTVKVNWFEYPTETNYKTGIEDMFRSSGYTGYAGHNVLIYAYDENDERIAEGSTPETYTYKAPNGLIGTPQNPRWIDDHIATWDPVEGAECYIVFLNENGEQIETYFAWYSTEVDFAEYIKPGKEYSFLLRAHAKDYGDSYESFTSPFIRGKEGAVQERIYGAGRYETSLKIAEEVRKIWGLDAFTAAVITTGTNYPDALSGSFLANKNKAPMLMINAKSAPDVVQYIRYNVQSGGTVYILGGDAAVKDEWVAPLAEAGYRIVRLAGKNRYLTNLEILKEAKVNEGTILVCTGAGFADSLSCSSLPYPILLVGKSLNAAQKEFLQTLNKSGTRFYVIGGTGAVSDEIMNELGNYGQIMGRIAGKDRYQTSVNIATTFINTAGKVVIATGKNFPDGLSGGPLAYALGAPLILVADGKADKAAEYTSQAVLSVAYALGGTGAISDETMNKVFHNGQ